MSEPGTKGIKLGQNDIARIEEELGAVISGGGEGSDYANALRDNYVIKADKLDGQNAAKRPGSSS